jgi:hypothetical protein
LNNLVKVCDRRFRRYASPQKISASAVALGFGKENASALIKAFEDEAGTEVKALNRQL